MEIGSAAAQALANGTHAHLLMFVFALSFRCFLLLQARQLHQCTTLLHTYFLPISKCIFIFGDTACMFRLLLIVSVTLEANPFLAGASLSYRFHHPISVLICQPLQAFLKLLISTGSVSLAHTALTVMQVSHEFFVILAYHAGF
jgi:hypothetical protein